MCPTSYGEIWSAPFFSAYSFVLARAQEYEADRASARVVGARQAADALINVNVYGASLKEEFWPALYRQADRRAEPPAPYTALRRAFRAGVAPDEAETWLHQALSKRTGSADTHPSLADRLAALEQEQRLPPPVTESAADHFLGDAVEELTGRLDGAWQARAAGPWHKRYERARLTEEFGDGAGAPALYREVLRLDPEHAGARYALGRALLSRGDEDGVALIEGAMERDPDAILPGCRLIHAHLKRAGREEEAQVYRQRALRRAELLEAAKEERARLRLSDTYCPHGLPAAATERLRAQFTRYPQLTAAYLVRKEVRHFPERPLYALGILTARPWYRRRSEEQDLQFARRLLEELEFPGETFVLVLTGRNAKLRKIMERTPNSLIYRRERQPASSRDGRRMTPA